MSLNYGFIESNKGTFAFGFQRKGFSFSLHLWCLNYEPGTLRPGVWKNSSAEMLRPEFSAQQMKVHCIDSIVAGSTDSFPSAPNSWFLVS